jgi:hypothetical protein
MKGYAKLYIRKNTNIVTFGMQNEGCRQYLDVQVRNWQNRAFKGI